MEYCKATLADREELIAFLNEIFECDFQIIMKKVYDIGHNMEQIHHLVKEDGKIVAAVGVYEQEFHIGESVLNTGFVGSVSVAKEARGKGYMRFLMEKAEQEMRNQGISLAMLGGRRNRYGFFGYEIGGQYVEYKFEEENIRHTIGWGQDSRIQLVLVGDTEKEVLHDIYKLYQKNRLWCRQRDDFYVRSLTWGQLLYQIQEDGQMLGYLLCDDKKTYIAEIELEDWNKLLPVVRACLSLNDNKRLTIQAHLWENEKSEALQKVCEFYQVMPNCSYKILDYIKTLTALLQLQQSCTKLEDGVFCIAVQKIGCFEMKVEKGKIQVSEISHTITSPGEKIDLELSERDVISALMSPAACLFERKSQHSYPNGWFPFKFAPCNVDEF